MTSLGDAVAALARLENERRVRVSVAQPSLLALTVGHLAERERGRGRQPVVVVARDGPSAEALKRDLEFFLPPLHAAPSDGTQAAPALSAIAAPPRVMLLPEHETAPWADISPDRRAIVERMAVLFRLSQGLAGDVLVASPGTLARRVIPRPAFARLVDVLEAEQEIDREATLNLLVRGGYQRTPVVEDPGTFAVRGGVIDVFVPLYQFPVRIDLLGDLVESLRFFDPKTQRTFTRTLHELYLHPVRESVVTAPDGLRRRLLEAGDHAAHPSAKTRAVLDQLEAGEDFFGIEALTPAMHESMVPLADYLPAEGMLILDDPDAIVAALDEEWARAEDAYQRRLAEHRLAFPPANFYLRPEELRELLRPVGAGRRIVESVPLELDGNPSPMVHIKGESNGELSAELRRGLAEKHEELLRPLVRRIREWQADGGRTVLVSPNPQHGERLLSLLGGYGIAAGLVRTAARRPGMGAPQASERGSVEIQVGSLVHGFRFLGDGLWVVTEAEIFGERAARSSASLEGTPASARPHAIPDLDSFRNLEVGGYVVHRLHGVGLYRGLTKLPVAHGTPVDFLHLEYEGGALYLPVWRLSEVTRYLGAEGVAPRVDRLGGITWERTRRKVSREVQKLAEELLRIYAQRRALPGFSAALQPHDEQMLREFEATFPFEETPDQQRAIDEVLAEMDEPRPMDRLVCGDVGYGKTEVALRASVKAVLAGKQVAVLAPTTVLVEQHASTFSERMKDYPVRVAALSRFQPRAAQLRVIKGLAEGQIDIVIGTHRLLSPDVRWKDLGLLVIDEEHRFGVAHKERIKALRSQIDCLTMSATPIPRTLHMALAGLREISIITTPPADRLAIRTLLARADDAVIVEGIRRELSRGGQVFFVHNRIEDIGKWAERLRGLIPGVRLAIGHGQLPSEELERVMVDFVDGKYDLLLCTTIIESGLDIGRANTMFVNRADCFGLAQLYQLRGRIGRAKLRAYCYLLIPPESTITTEAKQRLAVLQRFSELGSGFQIASHDLEIRGAGELLGVKQSGTIAAVGFDMYTQLLEEAVAALSGEAVVRERDPELTCDLPGFIPDDYLPDTAQRLDFYQRFSNARDADEIDALVSELTDRYGTPPDEVGVLAGIMMVKGLGRKLAATAIELSEQRLAVALDERTPLKPDQVLRMVNKRGTLWRLTPDMRLVRNWSESEREGRLLLARKLLESLLQTAA